MMETVSCQLCSLLLPNLQIYISHLRQVQILIFHCFVYLKVALINHFITFGAFNSYVYQTHRSVLGLDIANKDNMEETILLLL